jgi:hypothetical protein
MTTAGAGDMAISESATKSFSTSSEEMVVAATIATIEMTEMTGEVAESLGRKDLSKVLLLIS